MGTQAYILINVVLGKEKEILDELNKLDEIMEAYITMGSFDLIAKADVPDTKDLRPLVTNKIRTINGVRQTMTVIVV